LEDWTAEKARQKDIDARWTKKNDETHYGCKDHVKADAATKLITFFKVTDASVPDSNMLDQLINDEDKVVFADSAYHSKVQLERMAAAGIKK